MNERNVSVDIVKGILIILVVMAHYARDTFHDVVFLFHMPLFFMLSGFLQSPIQNQKRLAEKIKRLMRPYLVYLLIDYLLIKRSFSFSALLQMVWGGRYADGVYWYITCYLVILCLFFLSRKASIKMQKALLLLCGGIGVLESNVLTLFSEKDELLHLFVTPGVPWNADVSLLAAVYFAIGFYHKDRIQTFLSKRSWRYDVLAVSIAIAFAAFCLWNYKDGQPIYYFDMKCVKYQRYVLSIAIPCGVGFVLARLMYWISCIRWLEKLRMLVSMLGQMTLPIMMMHVPLNTWKGTIGYGRWIYVLIGVGIPVILVMALGRYQVCKRWLGIPNLEASSPKKTTNDDHRGGFHIDRPAAR